MTPDLVFFTTVPELVDQLERIGVSHCHDLTYSQVKRYRAAVRALRALLDELAKEPQ